MIVNPDFHVYPPEEQFALLRRPLRARLERLEQMAGEQCAEFIDRHASVSLALSFGKDSMAVLHVLHVHRLLDRLRIVMWNGSGLDTPDTLAMRDYVIDRYGLTNYVETMPDAETLARTLRMVDPQATHPIRDFVYEVLELPRWRVMDEHEIDSTILGLRSDESRGRRILYFTHGTEYHNRREKADILLPIMRWRTEDVYQYSAMRNIPLHPIYHRMPALGFAREGVRHCTPINLAGATHGTMIAYKRLYPEIVRRYASCAPAIMTLT